MKDDFVFSFSLFPIDQQIIFVIIFIQVVNFYCLPGFRIYRIQGLQALTF